MTTQIPWSAHCIRLDHGKTFLKDNVGLYAGFCFVPSHLQYEQKVAGFYNRYQSFQHYENILVLLQSEIPYFIHFLIHRDFACQHQTRMWFTSGQFATPAFKKLLNQNRNKLELDIPPILLTIADQKDLDKIKVCTADVQEWLNKKQVRYKDRIQIKRILQNVWKLVPAKNSLSYP